jgi:hypothetical protein
MKNLIKNIVCMTFIAVFFAGLSAEADIYQQDFDSWTGAPQSSFTNSTDSSGWSGISTKVFGGTRGLFPYSDDWYAAMQSDGAYVKSPMLTNGIGFISFRYGIDGTTLAFNFDVQISGDGSNWTTIDTINTGTGAGTWYEYTKNLNHYSNLYFRIECKTTSTTRLLGIDSINITHPDPDAVITDTTVLPDNIYDDDEVTVVTDIEKLGILSNFVATAYWKSGGAWTSINMTNTTGNAYVASSNIPPQTAGIRVEYYVEVTFTGDNSPIYSPTGGSSSPYSYNVQAEAFKSKFASMDVNFSEIDGTPSQTVEMFLDGNDYRQGVSVYDTSYSGGTKFTFDAITTNSISKSYGSAITSDFPVDGDLVLDGADITTTNDIFNQVVFRVDETDMSFSAQLCNYMDFTDWPTTSGYTDSEYEDSTSSIWKAYNALITTDNERKFRGKAAYLNSTGTTSYIRSPEVTKGFGELTFWYRSFTNSGPAASFAVELSETGGTPDAEWATLTNVTDISVAEYLKFTVFMNDRASKYIRIKSTGSQNLCIDDIVIGFAPAGVVLDNINPVPENPNVLDSVYMYADITAMMGAQDIVAKLYYRLGTEGNYTQIGMINRSNNTYDAASAFPVGWNGTLQYYFEVQFEGSSGQETVYYPSEAGDSPYDLEYTDVSYEQNFDSWPGAPQSVFTNSSDSTGWSVYNIKVTDGTRRIAPYSGDYCAVVDYTGYVKTPMLENGIGVLKFKYALDGEIDYEIEIQSSTDGSTWITEDTVNVSSPKETWLDYSEVLLITEPVYMRIKMSNPTQYRLLLIDDIVVTLPSASVNIGTQTRTPNYVAYSEPVNINCIFSSATPSLPAHDIGGKIFYRKKGSGTSFSSVDMENTEPGNYLGTIPGGVVENGDTIEYYIQSTFKGYAYTNSLNFSPTYSPDGIITQGSSYYAPPTEYFEYDTRRFASDVATMVINMSNDVDTVVTPIVMGQYSDNVWQGIISMGDYEKVFLGISAANIKINTASTATNIVYGDGTQVETTPPIVATAKPGDPSIEVTGVTNQQYVVRLDMETKDYILLACDAQNFNDWFLDSQYYALGQNSQGGANKWTEDFEDWSTNSQRKLNVNFNDDDWVEPDLGQNHWIYPDQDSTWIPIFWAQYQYRIYNSKLYNDPTNNIAVAQMQPSKSRTFMFPSFSNDIHPYGVGTVSFKYRVYDGNVYPVMADWTGVTNFVSKRDYRVVAYVKGSGENFDDGDYHAIRLRQVDEFNYVECRVVQTHGNRYYLEIWLCEAGVLTRQWRNSGTDMEGFLGSLEEGGKMEARIEDYSSKVRVRLNFNSNSGTANRTTGDRAFPATNLYGYDGTYGFAASGANMIVTSYSVTDWGDSTIWWTENFYENDPSVIQFDDNWVHVVTTNEADAVDGRMQRMGVGNLSETPSTGLSVSLDPGDDTDGVSENRSSWITYSQEIGLTNLYYKEMTVNVHTADHAFAIIDRPEAYEDLSIRFHDIEITGWVGDVLTTNDWVNNYGWIQYENYEIQGVTYSNRYVELRRSKTPAADRQYIASERYDTLGSFGFKYMIPSGSAPPTLKVWKASNLSNPATWQVVVSNVVDTSDARDEWLFFSRSVGDENDGVLILENASAADSDAIVRLDDITIYPFGGGSDSSWSAYNARITGDENTFEGIQSGFLNLDGNSDTLDEIDYEAHNPYIRTPKMNNGIGEISFWYAMLDAPAAELDYALLRVEKSDTGEDDDWDLLTEFEVGSADYQFFSTNIFDTVSRYVRFSNVTNGVPKRLALDDILVIDPYATSLDVQTVRTVPEQPLSTDEVKVQADLTNYKFGPYDINPVTYYYYSTNLWGKWDTNLADGTLEMEQIAANTNVSPTVYTYQTIDSIPSDEPNTCVQYYVSVEYDGEVFADKTSPQIFRQALTNPSWYEPINYYTTYGSSEYNNPYYIVYSCPPGAVWFNEVNVQDGYFSSLYGYYLDTGTNGYVELTGKAGIDISGWSLEMYNDQNQKVKTYTIGPSTILANDKDGYGFFVFGAPLVQNKDMELDHEFSDMVWGDPNYIKVPGGLVLKRDFGAIEYKVSFNTDQLTSEGFTYLGDDEYANSGWDVGYTKSFQLIGSGSNYYDFAWSWEEGFTPGTVNTGQTITGGGSNEFAIIVTDYWFDGTTVYIVSEGTGDWSAPEVWYATNLVVDTPEWSKLDGVTSEGSGSVVTQSFTITASPESPTTYYRIKGREN